jgi:predicted GNAT superfamily acetyltransferase
MTSMAKMFNTVINAACDRLPYDWKIEIQIERECGSVELYNPLGDPVDYPSNHESLLEDIDDAIEYAKQHDKDFE